MEKTLRAEIPVDVSSPYKVMGIVYDPNGCCKDRPILITTNRMHNRNNKINYSCQCACGMWCTSGHPNASEALHEYEQMTKRKFKEE